jgi:GNAT superfamily N-acetyltransferase
MPVERFEIRRAALGDEAALRSLRVQALTDAPSAFGSTLERELARPPAEWTSWLSPNAIFFAETEDGAAGMAAGVRDAQAAGVVWLMAMWVRPDLRGSGAADRLVEAVVAWAAEVGGERVRLDVVQNNKAAIRLYERHGFRRTGHVVARARDGAVEMRMERAIVERRVPDGFPLPP